MNDQTTPQTGARSTSASASPPPPPPPPPPDAPPFRYTAKLADEIETRWQTAWERNDVFRVPNPGDPGFDPNKPRFFCLDMFPYPSGAGLHVGHPEGYTATDIVSRYKRLNGFNVLHPMGWDAFGLPAEQYAIDTGVHPEVTTKQAIENFRRQLKRFGFSYDWSREFATIDQDYYRWTQWIWLKAYDAWYDRKEERARPIGDLVDELEADRCRVDGEGEVRHGPDWGADARRWADLDPAERRVFIDQQRLAYLGEQTVNWCPQLGTALANEEVIDGKSERGDHPVLRKPLKQWMFRITAFAERLLRDLEGLDWPDSTLAMQREWIGRSEGAIIDFALHDPPTDAPADSLSGGAGFLRVYTTRPDTIFGATYMVLAPEHPLVESMLADPHPDSDVDRIRDYVARARDRADVDRMADTKEKSGVATGFDAINPANGRRIPIWIADYVLMGYGHGAIMAVPAHDQRDLDFARAFELAVVEVVQPSDGRSIDGQMTDPSGGTIAFAITGRSVNSSHAGTVSIDGLETGEAQAKIIEWLEAEGIGRRRVNFKLRDWLFSRQRYWGEPFPVVYDEQGNHHPVDEAHLPVVLPSMTDYHPIASDEPRPLLAKATQWVNTTAGEAGVSPDHLPPDAPVRRETNTMPGWAGSCWYYLRFCDPHNGERFVSPQAEHYWMGPDGASGAGRIGGVDLYVGGAEHAVLHLLYARFWHKILFDLGEVSTAEPMRRLFHQGMITSFAYQRADKTLAPIDTVEEVEEGRFADRETGEPVTQVTAKMSKSLKNVVNPDEVIGDYGADTFRLYEMYMGPLEATKPWNTQDIAGPFRFLQRVWRLVVDEETGGLVLAEHPDKGVERSLHRTIGKVGADIERLAFNTAIAAMMEFVNEALKAGGITRDQLARFAVILSPFAPHIAEELWSKVDGEQTVADQAWPAHDPALLREEVIELPVQVQGKVRGRIRVPADADSATVEAAALADDRIKEQLAGKTVRKVIVVPGKIVNIIAG